MRAIKIGREKTKLFNNNFDKVYDYYKKKAVKMGYKGDLKLIKEKSFILIYIENHLEDFNKPSDDLTQNLSS